MNQYLNLLNELVNQPTRSDRTGVGVRGVFNRSLEYDLREGFPILTTKKMAYKSAIAETLWFISGSTDRRDLQWYQHGNFNDERFDIWKGNCLDRLKQPEGDIRFSGYNLGNMYGMMWRNNPNKGKGYYVNKTLNESFDIIDLNSIDEFSEEIYGNEDYYEISSNINNISETLLGYIGGQCFGNLIQKELIFDIKNEVKSIMGYQEIIDNASENGNVSFVIKIIDSELAVTRNNLVIIPNNNEDIRNKNLQNLIETNKRFDQLQHCIDLIKNDPTSRRIIMDSWNPRTTENACLAICHPFVQFYVTDEGELDMMVLIRSNDFFLGNPFNTIGYALLLEIVAKETGLIARKLHINMNDVHLYENHVEQALIQLEREPMELCKIELKDDKRFDEYVLDDIEIIGYESHDSIKASMAV